MNKPRIGAFALLICLGSLPGCGTRLVHEPVFRNAEGNVEIELRRTTKGGDVIARNFAHPATISDVRIAHILAHMEYDHAKVGRSPVFRSQHIYDLATGLARAFERAGPSDEVIAWSGVVERRLGIFTVRYITAFRAFLHNDLMRIEFFRIEEEWEPDPRDPDDSEYEAPEEPPTPALKLEAGEARQVRARGFDVAWRDPFYRRPVHLSRQGGGLRKRTVLLEEPEAPPIEEAPAPVSMPAPKIREAQLTALDQLDRARRNGSMTENEFQQRRRLVLEGRLEEAGFAP